MARLAQVVLESDLVDSTKPGDRLYVTGIHRALPGKANTNGTFKTIILGNAVRSRPGSLSAGEVGRGGLGRTPPPAPCRPTAERGHRSGETGRGGMRQRARRPAAARDCRPHFSRTLSPSDPLLTPAQVRLLTKHLGSSQFTEDDVKHIKEISRRSDTLALLSESLAPSVFGHTQEKRALLMMLLGGTERNLANGATTRARRRATGRPYAPSLTSRPSPRCL